MKINTKELTLIALNTVFIACLAQITIPFGLVPFTLQVFAITLISFIYSLKITLFSVISYLTLGFLGLPFFNNMQSGMMVFFSPTIGFLLGFPGYAYIINKLKNKFTYPFPFIIASVYLYTFGLLGIHLIFSTVYKIPLTFSESLVKYALIFIPSDFVSYSIANKLKDRLSTQLKLHQNTL